MNHSGLLRNCKDRKKFYHFTEPSRSNPFHTRSPNRSVFLILKLYLPIPNPDEFTNCCVLCMFSAQESECLTWGHRQARESQVGSVSLDPSRCTELVILPPHPGSLVGRPWRSIAKFSLRAHSPASQRVHTA